MDKDVINFIGRFTDNGKNQDTIDTFTKGCCYWFATILVIRFWSRGADVVYDTVANHFGARIGGKVYDATGDVTDQYDWQRWPDVVIHDPFEESRIRRDCILF